MPAQVVVVGSMVSDYITRTPKFPRAGETVFGHNFSEGLGGKGANQCLVAERLGGETAFVGKLGVDSTGDKYLAGLRKTSINVDFITRTDEAQSAIANVLVDDSGENCIVNIPGSNWKLKVEDVNAAADVIKNAKVLVTQNEVTVEATKTAVKLARQHGVVTLHNAGPGVPDLDPELISCCDIFCVNETEAECLAGCQVSSVEDAVRAGRLLLQKGCKSALVTLGAQGVVSVDGPDNFIHVPAEKVKAVDSTGAGDAFIGALAYFMAYFPKLEYKEQLRRSCAVATASVLKPGAWNSFLYRNELPSSLFQE